jgi:hypothetical protein
MLYNPKWNPPSTEGFRAWVKQQEQAKTFEYSDTDCCPVGLYLQSCGTTWEAFQDKKLLNLLNHTAWAAWSGAQAMSIYPTFGDLLRIVDLQLKFERRTRPTLAVVGETS